MSSLPSQVPRLLLLMTVAVRGTMQQLRMLRLQQAIARACGHGAHEALQCCLSKRDAESHIVGR